MIDQISQQIDDREQDLRDALTNAQVVEEAILVLSRDILDLQRKKKDLQISESKSKHSVRQIQGLLRVLRARFWNEKGGI